MKDFGPSLLQGLGAGPLSGPTVEEMEAARERVVNRKSIQIVDYHVETFDLSSTPRRREYAKRMKLLMSMQMESKVAITAFDRQFVTDDDKPRWLVHMEWVEYELQEEPVPPVGTPDTGE